MKSVDDATCRLLKKKKTIRARFSYLGVLERHVDGETRTEARESFEVGGVGQRAAALGEHGEGQRFEVLAVDVALPAVHRLQQILAGDDLREK